MMDTRKRSLIKGLTWRALAMLDTVLLALIFTGSIKAALSIGGIELVTKVVWYYAHERLWFYIPSEHDEYPNLSRWLGHHTQTRSFLKAVSWRFFGALDTFLIALIVTGRLSASVSIGGTELVTKIILYYLHERAWLHVRWGKLQPPANRSGSRLRNLAEIIYRHYHIGVVVLYALACVLFVAVSAACIYALHALLAHVPTNFFY